MSKTFINGPRSLRFLLMTDRELTLVISVGIARLVAS